jgi:hypothetical protein
MLFNRNEGDRQHLSELQRADLVTLGLIGAGVIFASLGLGEAVYRLAFFDFNGATDRLPIEMFFGIVFAWLTMKVIRGIYRRRLETSARINVIWERNRKIRSAVEAIAPVPSPGHQQAIRVIRDEVERIEGALDSLRSR